VHASGSGSEGLQVEQSTLHRPRTLKGAASPGAPLALRPSLPRITVVHDNPEFTALVVDVFSGQFEVTAARGTSPNAIADTLPHLLIADVRAPHDGGLAGWELVRLARRHRVLCHVPIVLCTTHRIALDIDGKRLAEFSDVHLLALPFALDVLERLVRSLIQPAPRLIGTQ
jgi:CheY-like chemotaxis protein